MTDTPKPEVIYVVTDLEPRCEVPPVSEPDPDPYRVLWDALRPVIDLAMVVVPILATTALAAGLLLGWPPLVLAVAAVLALPILTSLIDLAGARLGWPPLTWTAARLAANRRRPAPSDATEEPATDE